MTRSALDLNLVRTFIAVAEAGSFTAAADALDLTRPQVSQQIARLERHLDARLFNRTTRRVQPTEPGQRLFERCAPLLHDLVGAAEALGASTHGLVGRLRVAAPVDHAARVLAPLLAEFAQRHPELDIELRAADRIGDLVAEGIDVAFRVGWLTESSLRASKLGEFEQRVVASPAYLERAGVPRRPEDLADHRWVALTLLKSPLTWTFRDGRREVGVRMRSTLRTDSPTALRGLLQAGAGVSVVPELHVQRELQSGALVPLLTRWRLPRGGVHAVLPPGRHIPARSQALVTFVRQRLDAP